MHTGGKVEQRNDGAMGLLFLVRFCVRVASERCRAYATAQNELYILFRFALFSFPPGMMQTK